jgi:hypothetical protein
VEGIITYYTFPSPKVKRKTNPANRKKLKRNENKSVKMLQRRLGEHRMSFWGGDTDERAWSI